MEQSYFNLPIRPISVVANETLNYIKARKEHNVISLATRWKKLNRCCMGGIEPNTVYTIAGISGSGKSSVANLIQTDLIDLNPNRNIVVLTFSLEMVGFRQIGRTLSNKLRRTTSDLYSSHQDLDDDTYQKVINVSNQLKNYPIYFVDNPGSPEQVRQTILSFYDKYVKDQNKYFVIIYDHTLLTKRVGTTIETMSELQEVFIQIKKLPLTSIIQLSQMNRNIESPERINNSLAHYPMRSDLSSSDSIFQASDYVLVIHRPEILNIHEYGPDHLPTKTRYTFTYLKIEMLVNLVFSNLKMT